MAEVYAGGTRLVEIVRSGFVEGHHCGSVVVLDVAGEVVAAAGDVRAPVFPRSSNKPLQAVGMLRSGLCPAEEADLALICASHHGEDQHESRVRRMLGDVGLTEAALGCPPDLPLAEAARTAHLRSGGEPAPILMNCSGKHAGMLLTCRAAGWPVHGYWEPGHPLQERIRVTVEELTGERVAAVGVDGCGAPVLAVSLTGLARSYLRLVSAAPGTPERSVADAMRAHPALVSGTAGEENKLVTALPGLLLKPGAEGVVAAAFPGRGAVAVKIDDGARRGWLPVLVSALRRLGLTGAVLDELAEVPVRGRGVPVGGVRALW